MPFLVVVTPNIPADRKDEFLGAWPQVKEDIAKQPGVIGVAGGHVINENGTPVTDFKFLQTISEILLLKSSCLAVPKSLRSFRVRGR